MADKEWQERMPARADADVATTLVTSHSPSSALGSDVGLAAIPSGLASPEGAYMWPTYGLPRATSSDLFELALGTDLPPNGQGRGVLAVVSNPNHGNFPTAERGAGLVRRRRSVVSLEPQGAQLRDVSGSPQIPPRAPPELRFPPVAPSPCCWFLARFHWQRVFGLSRFSAFPADC